MTDNLRKKTAHALFWSFLQTLSQRGIQFLIGIVLARILFPEQFGLIAMLTIFIEVIRVFVNSGFGAALIQKREITQTDICSVFYFNIFMGLAGAGLLSLAAPWIAAFYHQPILTPLTQALSLTLVIQSFALIQNTLLNKKIDFKTQTQIGLIAGTLSGVSGIVLALWGYGVWSLVAQQISAALLTTLLLWIFNPWKPALVFSFRALGELFGFGSRLLAAGVLNQIFDHIYLLVIGRLYSPADLGLFARAASMKDLPSKTLSEMVARVTFPVFSTIQDDRGRLKRGLKKALTNLVLVNFPMMIGLAIIAQPLVLILLTEKWLGCVPYLQLLCIAGLLYPLHLINLNVLNAVGRSDLFLRLEIVKKILVVINIAVTWRWGISAMIWGMIVLSVGSCYLNSYYTGILLDYPIREQVTDLAAYLLMAILMGGAVFAVGYIPFPNPWSLLLAQIATGFLAYVSACRLFQLKAFMDQWDAVWSRIPTWTAGTAK